MQKKYYNDLQWIKNINFEKEIVKIKVIDKTDKEEKELEELLRNIEIMIEDIENYTLPVEEFLKENGIKVEETIDEYDRYYSYVILNDGEVIKLDDNYEAVLTQLGLYEKYKEQDEQKEHILKILRKLFSQLSILLEYYKKCVKEICIKII